MAHRTSRRVNLPHSWTQGNSVLVVYPLRADVWRQAVQKRIKHLASELQRSSGLFLGGFFRVARISKSPGVLGEFRRSPEQGLKCLIDRGARLPDFDKIMGLAIDPSMPGQKPLHRLFSSLLCMEHDVEVKGGTAPSSNVPARTSFPAFENQARVSATRAGSCGMKQFAFPHNGGG